MHYLHSMSNSSSSSINLILRFLSQHRYLHRYHLDCNLPVTESNLSLLQVTLFAAGGVGKCASAYDCSSALHRSNRII